MAHHLNFTGHPARQLPQDEVHRDTVSLEAEWLDDGSRVSISAATLAAG
jgi:hypothetical protein